MDRTKVLDIIRDGAGSQFDPSLVSAFLSLDFGEWEQLVAAHRLDETPAPLEDAA